MMTVAIAAKTEITRSDENDNETCCADKEYEYPSSIVRNSRESKQIETEPKNEEHRKEAPTEKPKRDEIADEKARMLLHYDEAPSYMKHNSYILSGYRGILDTKLCLESIFWWTNETINIWSHIFGSVLFICLGIKAFYMFKLVPQFGDKVILTMVLICFVSCMVLSSLYHTFSCRSEQDCELFLSLDLFGIALSLFAIYSSGIYYAFWCNPDLQTFYTFTVTVIFIFAMLLQLPKFQVHPNVKMITFVGWAAYGVIPIMHWTMMMGGFENPLVRMLFPRAMGMYGISGLAFVIYLAKIPERFFSGKFDYLGHSHQWWHFLVLGALYWWHNTGVMYFNYRINHACPPGQVSLI